VRGWIETDNHREGSAGKQRKQDRDFKIKQETLQIKTLLWTQPLGAVIGRSSVPVVAATREPGGGHRG